MFPSTFKPLLNLHLKSPLGGNFSKKSLWKSNTLFCSGFLVKYEVKPIQKVCMNTDYPNTPSPHCMSVDSVSLFISAWLQSLTTSPTAFSEYIPRLDFKNGHYDTFSKVHLIWSILETESLYIWIKVNLIIKVGFFSEVKQISIAISI